VPVLYYYIRPSKTGWLLRQHRMLLDTNKIIRLDILHHTYLVMMDDELTLAPIDPNPRKILDVGTGTGIWAIDMGE
jgi:ubiquinone/menaquinone biosynthesis C-methylase UbiE